MNRIRMSSLRRVAILKIATAIWNKNIRPQFFLYFGMSSTAPLFCCGKDQKWRKIEEYVTEQVLQLPLPENLKQEMSGVMKPLGHQILRWITSNGSYIVPIPIFCWTQEGRIHKKKTAELLVKDDRINIGERYKLACFNCFDDDILELWSKMSEHRRAGFCTDDLETFNGRNLVIYWTYFIKGELAKLDMRMVKIYGRKLPYNLHAFNMAVCSGSEAGTEYFFQILTTREKEMSVKHLTTFVADLRREFVLTQPDVNRVNYDAIFIFLLSHLTDEVQTLVFERCSLKVLQCLLEWPWQNLFLVIANRVYDFLSDNAFEWLLNKISAKVIEGYKDWSYRELFREFWKRSPNTHKRYVIDRCAGRSVLTNLFYIEDERNIKLILRDATLAQREKILFSHENICKELICKEKLEIVSIFVHECTTHRDLILKFRDEFKKYFAEMFENERKKKEIWCKWFKMTDFLMSKDNKTRRMEEGESSSAKRFQSAKFEE